MLIAHWRIFRERATEQKDIRCASSEVCPRRTGWVALMLVALLALGMILYLGIVSATAEGQTMYVCTVEDALNVRDEPALHAPWVYRLERGEAVTVHEVRDGWCYIEWVGQYGWAWAEYLADAPPVDKLPEEFLEVDLE